MKVFCHTNDDRFHLFRPWTQRRVTVTPAIDEPVHVVPFTSERVSDSQIRTGPSPATLALSNLWQAWVPDAEAHMQTYGTSCVGVQFIERSRVHAFSIELEHVSLSKVHLTLFAIGLALLISGGGSSPSRIYGLVLVGPAVVPLWCLRQIAVWLPSAFVLLTIGVFALLFEGSALEACLQSLTRASLEWNLELRCALVIYVIISCALTLAWVATHASRKTTLLASAVTGTFMGVGCIFLVASTQTWTAAGSGLVVTLIFRSYVLQAPSLSPVACLCLYALPVNKRKLFVAPVAPKSRREYFEDAAIFTTLALSKLKRSAAEYRKSFRNIYSEDAPAFLSDPNFDQFVAGNASDVPIEQRAAWVEHIRKEVALI